MEGVVGVLLGGVATLCLGLAVLRSEGGERKRWLKTVVRRRNLIIGLFVPSKVHSEAFGALLFMRHEQRCAQIMLYHVKFDVVKWHVLYKMYSPNLRLTKALSQYCLCFLSPLSSFPETFRSVLVSALLRLLG